MQEVEQIIEAVHTALSGTPTALRVLRSPDSAIPTDGWPAIHIFEGSDSVAKVNRFPKAGKLYPVNQRILSLRVEFFVKGTSEGTANKELRGFVAAAKAALFANGTAILGLGEIEESGDTGIVNVAGVAHARAMGVDFKIKYNESIAALMQ